MNLEDVCDVLDVEGLTTEELIQFCEENDQHLDDNDDEGGEDDGVKNEQGLWYSPLNKFLKLAEELKDTCIEIDPDMNRSLNFAAGIKRLLEPYEQIKRDLVDSSVQPKITKYFRK